MPHCGGRKAPVYIFVYGGDRVPVRLSGYHAHMRRKKAGLNTQVAADKCILQDMRRGKAEWLGTGHHSP